MKLDKEILEKMIGESAKDMAREIYEYGGCSTFSLEHIDEESGWEIHGDISCEIDITASGEGYWEPEETTVRVKHLRIYGFSILHYDEDTENETPIEGEELEKLREDYEDWLVEELCA